LIGYAHYVHREVAERLLGRKLEPWEVVHHINGRRRDNRPENLCVMAEEDHDAYHDWYDWIYDYYGVYPRRETQLRKLRERFGGIVLSDRRGSIKALKIVHDKMYPIGYK
jgi:hypothetical protein